MNFPESLYEEILPFLEKIEKARKPYLWMRIIAYVSLAVMLAPFCFAIVSSILMQVGLIPEPGYTGSVQQFMCPLGNITVPCTTLLWDIFNKITGMLLVMGMFAMHFLYSPISLAQTEILSRILKKVSPNLSFKQKTILKEKVIRSGFFQKIQSKELFVMCKGIVEGKIDDVQVEFANVNIFNVGINLLFFVPFIGSALLLFSQFFQALKNVFGKNKDMYTAGFKGLFFIADFNKKLKGFTIVLPDAYEKHFGFLAKAVQELKKDKVDLVYLEDPRFEKEFVIYSTDQIEARYVLSLSFMERVLELKKKLQHPLLLSFRGNKIYIAVADPQGMLEIPLNENVLNPAILEKPYDDLLSCIEIISELKLNSNIWGGKIEQKENI